MDESNQLPLKRVELSLTQFNEVAIPHHLDLLRQHKANITKHEREGEAGRARAERAHAARVAARLRALLADMEALRGRVREPDRAAFDAATQPARDATLRAIADYLDAVAVPAAGRGERAAAEAAEAAGSAASTDSVGVLAREGGLVQLQVDERELALREREAALAGLGALQAEVEALHAVLRRVHGAARLQAEAVGRSEDAVGGAAAHVAAARGQLAGAARLRAAAWAAGGAALGAAAGGPVGLAVGAKAGALAALAGSLLGYATARLVARKQLRERDETD